MTDVLQKIKSRNAHVGVIGIGYVGLPIVVEFAKAGFHAVGFDLDQGRVDAVNRGESYIPDVPASELAPLVKSGKLRASADFSELGKMDTISVCVPTPLRKSKDPDISYIISATEAVRKTLSKGQLIVLESTTYPGTTDEVVIPMLNETGLVAGKDFFVAFSPERINPGDPVWGAKNTPKIIGGSSSTCNELAVALYSAIIEKVIPVSNTRTAEMVKLLENTYRAVNIGLVNEFAIICQKLELNVWEIIEAAATKPFGFMPFFPGPGLGGHCIPIDPLYLSWKLKSLNYNTRFIELADNINSAMPAFVVTKISDALNEHQKSINGSKILVLGLAYKKNITDPRESPSLDIIMLLKEKGAVVSYQDNFIPDYDHHGLKLKSVKLDYTALSGYDAVVIATDHGYFDPKLILENSKLVIDTRNTTKGFPTSKKLARL